MDERTLESHELEDNIEFRRHANKSSPIPSVNVNLHVGRNVEGEVTGIKINQISQPRLPLQRPPRAEHFIGREKELARLLKELQPGRVVTLCGPGGIGKTALASEVIWILAPDDDPPERFPDGIVFHSFYKQPQAELALENIARAFGEEPRPTSRDAALRALAGCKALIVLDGAEDADDLNLVLEICGCCGVLVTSQSRKDAPSKRVDIVQLSPDEAVKLLKAWGIEWASDQDSAEQICELVGGLPLALKLIGHYLAVSEVDATDYLSWLKTKPLEALTWGNRREESVPMVLEHIYEKLSDTACWVLGVVGILALAPFEGDAIGAALNLSKDDQIKALGELVNFNILIRNDQLYEVSHRLVYTYIRGRQRVDENVFLRVFIYYLGLTQENVKAGPAGYARLSIHRQNLLEILRACAKREEWRSAIILAWGLDDYLDLGGYWIERVETLKIGLEASKKLEDHEQESSFLGSLGISYRVLGQVERAIEHYKLALAIEREIGNRLNEGTWIGNLGNAYNELGQLEYAIEHYKQALAIARENGDQRGEGVWLGNLGIAYRKKGDVERAIEHYEQGLAIAKEIGDRRSEGNHHNNLGNACSELGQLMRAIEHYERALVITKEIGNRYGERDSLYNLACAYALQNDVEKALNFLTEAITIDEECATLAILDHDFDLIRNDPNFQAIFGTTE